MKQHRENIGKSYAIFDELNICDNFKMNKIDDTIPPVEILGFLLENGVLSDDDIRSATQSIRRNRQSSKISAKNILIKESAKVTNSDSNRTMDSTKHVSGMDSNNSAATAANEISPRTIRTRHIALRIFYDGASYSGLAQNVGQANDNSVERCIFDALRKARLIVSRETSNYSRCGRTDRGVSSAGQVVALHLKSAFPINVTWDEDGTSFLEEKDLPRNEFESRKVWAIPRSKKRKDTKSKKPNNHAERMVKEVTTMPVNRTERKISEYSYSKILNNILPPSIRILGWTPVTEEFSARFSANARTYRYFFCKRRMDLSAIQEGLNRLVGRHDFRNFCKMDVEKVYNFERLIHSAEVVEVRDRTLSTNGGQIYYFKIIGQAFLWHQIRCIAEVVFMIGNGFESPSIVTELLNVKKHPGKPSYCLADEKPLVLHDCGYPNLHFGYSVQNLWNVSCHLEKQWEELTLAATRIRSCIESLRSCSVLTEDLIAFSDSRLTERRRKLERKGIFEATTNDNKANIEDANASSKLIAWGNGLAWMEKVNLVPHSNGLTNSIHIPLLQRSMGPSYEEKIQNLKKSEKRRLKFEENIIKKRKSAEEDKAFYDHKIKQGGSGI